jgi:hypothetical protein
MRKYLRYFRASALGEDSGKSTVSMPEEGFVADLGIILLAVPWVMRRMRFA